MSSGGQTTMAASAADSATADAPGGSGYVLDGELPDGTPDDQPVYRLPDVTSDAAADVADALGLTGPVRRVDGGFVVEGDHHQLVVREDGGWSYGLDCAPDSPTSSTDDAVGCAYASSSGVAVAGSAPDGGSEPGCDPAASDCGDGAVTQPCKPETDDCVRDEPPVIKSPPETLPGPSESEARAAAAPVLAALGLSDARVTVWTSDPVATVQASPVVDGMDTVGWVTSLQIDADGAVTWADGYINSVTRGDSYPVVSAADAFAQLKDQPRPMMELCAVRKDGEPGCADLPPTTVTGAMLGLMLDYDGTRPLLVPAWLFEVKGQPEPIAQIAISPSYLAPVPVPSGPPADEPPTQVEPVKPMPVEGGGTGSGGSSGSSGSSDSR
jgi:hypothetical protein